MIKVKHILEANGGVSPMSLLKEIMNEHPDNLVDVVIHYTYKEDGEDRSQVRWSRQKYESVCYALVRIDQDVKNII